ncbi:hypothetical protein SLEP1_g48128 [Rubroshorea leprosula]|uniref:Uncharacterized protein n=1 Tax=Rubroshorea leprosula TaxID=152421 RepID=A0AAV5LTQ4_9ROSI|nr:hypothetical protein SLEP1_g48128 [Rubroshorea leprosula]
MRLLTENIRIQKEDILADFLKSLTGGHPETMVGVQVKACRQSLIFQDRSGFLNVQYLMKELIWSMMLPEATAGVASKFINHLHNSWKQSMATRSARKLARKPKSNLEFTGAIGCSLPNFVLPELHT